MKTLLIALAGALAVAGCSKTIVAAAADSSVKTPRAALPLEKGVELDLATTKRQVQEDRRGALGWAKLASAHLEQASVYDSYEDARAAEGAATESLRIRSRGNMAARVALIKALLDQHRFQDALAASHNVYREMPHSPASQKMLINCLLEVGAYTEARALFEKHSPNLSQEERLLLQSRLLEAYGQTPQALSAIKSLLTKAERDGAVRRYQAALQQRLGDLYWSAGDPAQAVTSYDRALALEPKSWRSLLGKCRALAAQENWKELVAVGHDTEKLVQMTEVVALIGDGYAGLGNRAMAEEHYAEAAHLAGYGGHAHSHGPGKRHGHPLDRQYAHFAAEHTRDLDGALKAAINDLKQRKDIKAYDTLAWVRYKRGELALARAAMEKAMRTGTQDAWVLRHQRLLNTTRAVRGALPNSRSSI
jgi:tetratricopeptide (TPR) repeat protein